MKEQEMLLLVYEPKEQVHSALEKEFKKFGMKTMFSKDANELLDKTVSIKPHAVLIREPEPEVAISICRKLKAVANFPSVAVIVQSNSEDIQTKLEVLTAKGDEYIPLSADLYKVALKTSKVILQKQQTAVREEKPTGSLGEVNIADILEFFKISRRTGQVTVKSSSGKEGKIVFEDGEMVDAVCGELRGEDAVLEMASWNKGVFEIKYEEKPELTEIPEEQTLKEKSTEPLSEITSNKSSQSTSIGITEVPLEDLFEQDVSEHEETKLKAELSSQMPSEVLIEETIREVSEPLEGKTPVEKHTVEEEVQKTDKKTTMEFGLFESEIKEQLEKILIEIHRDYGISFVLVFKLDSKKLVYYPNKNLEYYKIQNSMKSIAKLIKATLSNQEDFENLLNIKLENLDEIIIAYRTYTIYLKKFAERNWGFFVAFDHTVTPIGLVKATINKYLTKISEIIS